MKFTKLRFNGLTAVDLPIVGAQPSDLYILKGVDGLGPPEVDVSIADTLNAGGVYQGRRPQSREIVALVGLNPDYSAGQVVSDLRGSLYGLLTPGYVDYMTVDILDQEVLVATTSRGYVKKIEINPFTKDPEAQITVACEKWFLEAESLLYVTPADKAAPEIENTGNAPAGFHMEVIFTANTAGWTLGSASGAEMFINYSFQTGDKLEIDTRPGSRGIWVTRGGTRSNIIYALSSTSIWFMLHGGLNTFSTSSQNFNWGDVYYLPQYWGI